MKKISWVSCNSYMDTDLPIVVRLQKYYRIRFIVVISHDSTINYQNYINKTLQNSSNIEVEYFYLKHRLRSPKIISSFYVIIRKAKDFRPDLFYISYQGMPYALLLYKLMLPLNKCIVSCHNVTTPVGATNEKIAIRTTKWWLKSFKNINVFSKSQESALISAYTNKKVLYTPFFLKNYGENKVKVDRVKSRPIRFLSFGNIVKYKRIDLIIEAANILVDRGVNDFVVRIAGNCGNWGEYNSLIKHPEKFELYISRVPNEDVPSLFEETHYFLLPYQDIAQSGSMTVAFNYNVPPIVSDIEPFKEFIEDGKTGFSFTSQDATSLANVMQRCINEHEKIYPKLSRALQEFVAEHYSDKIILDKYKDFFEDLIKTNG